MEAAIVSALVSAGCAQFLQHFTGNEECILYTSQMNDEIGSVNGKIFDHYPQGKEKVIYFLAFCRDHNLRCRRVAVHTFPFWTWYYEKV